MVEGCLPGCEAYAYSAAADHADFGSSVRVRDTLMCAQAVAAAAYTLVASFTAMSSLRELLPPPPVATVIARER